MKDAVVLENLESGLFWEKYNDHILFYLLTRPVSHALRVAE